jgi:glycosyltransferase involved in cell wall biosynthesis
MSLSIVISCANDHFGKEAALLNTIKSIRETAGNAPEIVITDDCSATPVPDYPAAKVIHNRQPLGVGPSRHVGALHATGDILLICDSHMRFTPGWYEAAMHRVDARPHTLHCATCLALDAEHMDPAHPMTEYHGATLNIHGPDRANPSLTQTMEVVWNTRDVADDAEIAAVMGACYFIPSKWFLELEPLRFLRGWGADELMLSLKAWLSGGDIRLMKNVRIGHKFRLPGEKAPAFWPEHVLAWNKLFAVRTLLPQDLAERMEKLLRVPTDTLRLANENAGVIATEQARNRAMFRRDFVWYCRTFGLRVP